MKRLIYITYLSLLALILFACQKENVLPAASAQDADLNNLRPGPPCQTYAYQTKTGTVELGSVRSDNILVVFNPDVSQAQRQSLLSNFQIFNQFEPEFYTDSGDTIQVISLKPNANCNSTETMLATLQANPQVKFATPVFNAPPGSGLLWIGQTHEFLVTLVNTNSTSRFLKLVNATKTEIVYDFGFGSYLMKITPASPGDVLAISSYFNSISYVSIAEPNFLMQGPSLKMKPLSEIKNLAVAQNTHL